MNQLTPFGDMLSDVGDSYADAARKTGKSISCIQKLATGQRNRPRQDTLDDIVAVYPHVTPNDFYVRAQ